MSLYEIVLKIFIFISELIYISTHLTDLIERKSSLFIQKEMMYSIERLSVALHLSILYSLLLQTDETGRVVRAMHS